MEDLVEIGKDLKVARFRQGLSQEELAGKAGCSRYTIRHLERGVADTRIGTLAAICDALNIMIVITLQERRDESCQE